MKESTNTVTFPPNTTVLASPDGFPIDEHITGGPFHIVSFGPEGCRVDITRPRGNHPAVSSHISPPTSRRLGL